MGQKVLNYKQVWQEKDKIDVVKENIPKKMYRKSKIIFSDSDENPMECDSDHTEKNTCTLNTYPILYRNLNPIQNYLKQSKQP